MLGPAGRFHSEIKSNVFRPPFAEGISKRNTHWSVWINLGVREIIIVVTTMFPEKLRF